MSHQTTTVIIHSLFHVFDPNDPEYQGVREHFSTGELEEIDRIRGLSDEHDMTFAEKAFASYACSKAIFSGN